MPLRLVLLFLLFPYQVNAQQVVEQFDRFELNWSTMRLRFYGEVSGVSAHEASSTFRETERGAWQEGLTYASRNLPTVYRTRILQDNKAASAAAEKVTRSTYSYNTVYFADGSVRVHLENLLPRAVAPDDLKFSVSKAPDVSGLPNSGVILEVKGTEKPVPVFHVVSEKGDLLFSAQDVAEEAFYRSLMGRWFKGAVSESAVREAVGVNPVKVSGTFVDDRVLQVSAVEWQQKLQNQTDLLTASRIAVVMKR